jgi:hypothetical protein
MFQLTNLIVTLVLNGNSLEKFFKLQTSSGMFCFLPICIPVTIDIFVSSEYLWIS